ncbi:MAG: hypothetical protein AAB772_00230 [Patescibacteria group bacterium]
MNIWRIIGDLVEIAICGTAAVAHIIGGLGGGTATNNLSPSINAFQTYWGDLKRLAWIAVLGPILILIIGILTNSTALTVSVGIIWGIVTLLLLIIASPLVLLLETISGGEKGSGKRYVELITSVIFAESLFVFFISIIPIENNLSVLPLMVVAAIIVFIAGKFSFMRKIMVMTAAIVLVFLVFSLFYPQSAEFKKNQYFGHQADQKLLAVMKGEKLAPPAVISGQENQNHQPIHSELMILEEHRWKPFGINSNHFRVDPPTGKTIRMRLENGQVFQKRNNRLFRESDGIEVSCVGQGIGLSVDLAAGKGEGDFTAIVSTWPQDSLSMFDHKECREVVK